MRTADQWLDEYGSSHRNPTNEALHWICVPVILWCVLGFLWITPFPASVRAIIPLANWATVITLLAVIYYALLSIPLAQPMANRVRHGRWHTTPTKASSCLQWLQ